MSSRLQTILSDSWQALNALGDRPIDDIDDALDPIANLEGVSVSLGGVEALADVSVSIEPGRFVGLVGPNGAGKTTLLRTMTGAITPDRGQVQLVGTDVSSLSSRAVSQRVAVVPQESTLTFDFDVSEIIAMGRTPYQSRVHGRDRADRTAVKRAMAQTEVAEFADRSISEVSGGERQRILIARALAQDTPLLLLDEPTANLDINHQLRILNLVDDLVQEGKTVVAAIHDLNLAARFCDELVLLNEGRLEAQAGPTEVLTASRLESTFGTNTAIASDPVTGTTHVTPVQRTAQESAPTVHVIGSGRAAVSVLFELYRGGYDLSLGAIAETDVAREAASALDISAITVPTHAPIGTSAVSSVTEAVNEADATIVLETHITEATRLNLEAATEANHLFVVQDQSSQDLSSNAEVSQDIYQALSAEGTVVSIDELLESLHASI